MSQEKSFNGCVIGHPLGHSMSPLIHRAWLARYGIEGTYDARPVPPEDFDRDILEIVRGCDGFNITLPYKEKIIAYCASLDPAAAAIGAVNTVVRRQDGTLHGLNTDAYGFIANIGTRAPDFIIKGKTALVLGAGGAARAVLHGLKEAGAARLLIANRSRDKAEQLAGLFGCGIISWGDAPLCLHEIDILVNTTSLGMTGQPGLFLDLAALPRDALVCDIVYAPLMTHLLQAAQKRGNPYVTGIGMLLHQAALAFQAWTGILPDIDAALETRVLGAA